MSEPEILTDSQYRKLVSLMHPCPFCSASDSGGVILVHFHHWVAFCETCDARGPVSKTPQEAVEKWNERAT